MTWPGAAFSCVVRWGVSEVFHFYPIGRLASIPETGAAKTFQGLGGSIQLGPGSPQAAQWWVGICSGDDLELRWSKFVKDLDWMAKRVAGILLFVFLACLARWPWEATFPGVRQRNIGLVLAVGFSASAGLIYGAHGIHYLLTGSYIDFGEVSKRSPLLYGKFAMFISFYGPFVLAPIVEEVVFRGWLQRILTPLCKIWPALLLQAVAFGVVHHQGQGLNGVLMAGAIGVFLGAVFLFTGKLWPCILCHSLVNVYGRSGDIWWVWAGRPGVVDAPFLPSPLKEHKT